MNRQEVPAILNGTDKTRDIDQEGIPRAVNSPAHELLTLLTASETPQESIDHLTTSSKLRWKHVAPAFEAVRTYIETHGNEISYGAISAFGQFAADIWTSFGNTKKSEIETGIKTAIDKLPKDASGKAALLLVTWKRGIFDHAHEGDITENQKVHAGEVLSSQAILHDLFPLLPPTVWNDVGKLIMDSVAVHKNGKQMRELAQKRSISLPSVVLDAMVEAFAEAGYIKVTKKGNIKLTKMGEHHESLGFEEISRMQLAQSMLGDGTIKPDRQITSLKDIERIYKDARREFKVAEQTIRVPKDRYKILMLSEFLLGNKDADVALAQRILHYITSLSPEDRPDIIVVSGLLQGGFQHKDKSRRGALAIKSVDQQLQAARVYLTQLQVLGIPVIYNMSNDDFQICENYALEAIKMLQHAAKPLRDTEKRHINYWQIDQMKQTKAWDVHLAFQINVVFPYMLRLGRRLRSADEVAKMTGGKVRREEYFLLFEAYEALRKGKALDTSEFGSVIDISALPISGKRFPFEIVDDVNVTVKTEGNTYLHYLKHNFKFGDKPMYQNPTDAIEAIMGDLASSGKKTPDAFTIAHQQQGLALNAGDSWIISTPGLLKSHINERAAVANLQGEPSHRNYTTRRMTPTSGAFQIEQTDDGRTLFHVITDTFLQKALQTADPVTIATLNDWQTGSPTAQADLQVKYLDYLGTRVLPDNPVVLNIIGDIVQGRNFKGSELEKKRLGLVEIDDQVEFVRQFYTLATADISRENAQHISHVGIVPGNHEWNSAYLQTGAVHTQWIVSLMREFFLKRGIDPDKQKDFISFYRQWQGGPDHIIGWTGFEDVAGYGIMLQHLILEKGAKGGGGKAPVYEASTLNQGVNSLVRPIDIQEFGHWHHDMLGLFNGKIAVVAPSLAGLSSYEWLRGYRPHMGALLIHLGGGKAPVFEFLSPKTLYQHKVQGKYFSEKHLRSLGFKDDEHFDPAKHGFMTKKGAIQKALWQLKDDMLSETQATIAV